MIDKKVYIQIGTNVAGDHFQEMIEGLTESSKIILVEPVGYLHKNIALEYLELSKKHEIHICNNAISIYNERAKLNFYENCTAHCSLIESKYRNSINVKNNDINDFYVDCITFNELCDKYNIKEIEYLSIDTEGMDCEILYSIDLTKIDIKNIDFENWGGHLNLHENDSVDSKFRTGKKMMELVFEKYKDYEKTDIFIGTEASIKLEKINKSFDYI